MANGAHVVAGARESSAELEELARSGQAQIALVDLAGAEGPAAVVAQGGDRIDILINNVGSAPARTGGFLRISDADWHATLEINLMAAVRATRSAVLAMIAAGKGAIVSTCSVNTHLPDPAVLDYSAAKAALAGFLRRCRRNSGRMASGVNTLSPGPVTTDQWLSLDSRSSN